MTGQDLAAQAATLCLLITFHTSAQAERGDVDRTRPDRSSPHLRQTSDGAEPHPEPQRHGWYGGTMFVLDGAAIGLAVGGFAREDPYLFLSGYTTYVFGGPTVHLWEQRPSAALASFALRAAPLVLAAPLLEGAFRENAGAEGNDGSCREQCSMFMLLTTLGPVVAMVIDDAVWAHHPERASAGTWAPTLHVGQRAVSAGVVGQF